MNVSEPMTDSELDEIERRCNAATDGPWSWTPRVSRGQRNDYEMDSLDAPPGRGSVLNVNSDVYSESNSSEYIDGYPQDYAFIAKSRTDVPRLIAEVRRLRHELAERERTLDSGAAKIARLEDEIRTLRQIAGSFIELSNGRYKTIDDLREELNRERSV